MNVIYIKAAMVRIYEVIEAFGSYLEWGTPHTFEVGSCWRHQE